MGALLPEGVSLLSWPSVLFLSQMGFPIPESRRKPGSVETTRPQSQPHDGRNTMTEQMPREARTPWSRWKIADVTALPPGWVNVYRFNGELRTRPAPALLVMEYELVPVGAGPTRTVVFADFDRDSAELYPVNFADDCYVETMTEAQFRELVIRENGSR